MAIDREAILVAAQKYVEKKRYDKAIQEYLKIIQADPNDARTLLKIGDLQLKMEGFPEAIATYERVGRFYATQGFALKAIAVYKQVREIVQKHVPHLEERYAHIPPKLAELYQQLGLVSDALAALDEVATRLQRQQRDTEAIDVFRRIVSLDPTNPLPHLRLGEALSRARDAEGAVSEFGVAATLLVRLGRRDDALKVIERLLHHRTDATYAKMAADLYLQRGGVENAKLALPKLQICFQQDPKDLATLDLLARAFVALGQAQKGIEVQKEAARIAKEQGQLDVLDKLVNKLLQIAPNDEAVQQLARDRDEALANAEEESEEMLEEVPDDEPIPEPAMSEAEPFSLRTDPPPPMEHEQPGDAPELVSEVSYELVDEVDQSIQERVTQLIADAQSFQRVRLYARAVETLVEALELDGRSIAARALLRDVYLEMGRQADAVVEMINIASLQLDELDGDSAAQTLQEVMGLDPTNERAAQMLRELGYELVDEPQAPAAPPPPALPSRKRMDSYDPEAPLPSYELDEAPTNDEYRTVTTPGALADGPLPSFPLEAAESEAQFDLVAPDNAPSVKMIDAAPSSIKSSAADIEEALEEADFFASRGLFDDARAVLSEQLSRNPNHVLLRERLVELDAQQESAGASGTRAVPRPTHQSTVADEEDFDIAASLEALEGLEVAPEASSMMTEGQVDVEEVFAKFKEGVAKQISVDDGQAHYDLGLAYKEMGLAKDAISEFETAARDPQKECICLSMIGMIHTEAGEIKEAIVAFQRGLNARSRTPDQEVVLCFEIGASYETMRQPKEALNYFQRVARRDPSYRDVQDRIRKLTQPNAKPVRAAAVGADDEFDRAFDELLGGKS